jgi:cytochrome c oxidase cbb3-type subunit 3
MRVWGLAGAIFASAALAAACDRAPSSTNLKDWTPADHDQEPGRPAANQGAKGSGGGAAIAVELAWRNQCSTCHGPVGKADGPQAPMFKPTDLSNGEWQDKVKDADIAAVIKNGKGRMPRFDLPDDVVIGLVGRVRAFGGRAPTPSGSAPPPSAEQDKLVVELAKEASASVISKVARGITRDPAKPDEGDLAMQCSVLERGTAIQRAHALGDAALKKTIDDARNVCAFDAHVIEGVEHVKAASESKSDPERAAMCDVAAKELETAKKVRADDPRTRDLAARLSKVCKK